MEMKIFLLLGMVAALLLLAGCNQPVAPGTNGTNGANISNGTAALLNETCAATCPLDEVQAPFPGCGCPEENQTGANGTNGSGAGEVPAYNYTVKNITWNNCFLQFVNGSAFPFRDEQGREYFEYEHFDGRNYQVVFTPGIWYNATAAPVRLFNQNWTVYYVHPKDCAPEFAQTLAVGESWNFSGYEIALVGMREPACLGCEAQAEVFVAANGANISRVQVPLTGFRFQAPGAPRIGVQVYATDLSARETVFKTCADDGGSVWLLNAQTREQLVLTEGDNFCGYTVRLGWTILDTRYHDLDGLQKIELGR